jgi:hypothetical protein
MRNKAFSFLLFFLFGFVNFSGLIAQENKIVNKSSFIGFYCIQDCIGRIEGNKIQFYWFKDGVWQRDKQKEFTLPKGYTKAFFVSDCIGLVVPNSSGINTIQFYEPNNAFIRRSDWKRLTKADLILPAATIDVASHTRAARPFKIFDISVITQERIRKFVWLEDEGWKSYITDEEWRQKLPRGVSYIVGDITYPNSNYLIMPIVNNKVQFYIDSDDGEKMRYEFLLPNGYSDVFFAEDYDASFGSDGKFYIAVSINSEVRFYSVDFYSGKSDRLPDRDF